MTPAVYSLADVIVTFKYGSSKLTKVLSDCGSGRISISQAGDIGSHTTTATGYVVINKLRSPSGTCSLEIPVNSEADVFLRGWINYVKSCTNDEFANATLTLSDQMANRVTTLSNVIPQKEPDEAYDQTSGNRQYTLLYAEKTVV